MDNQYTIFYSWVSDLPNNTNRGFIQDALEKAVKNVKKSINLDVAIDRDILDVPGSPEIDKTIFEKISQADFFIADVSFINKRKEQQCPTCNPSLIGELKKEHRLTPNPNVLIELGYALAKMGENRFILVFNSASGKVEDLPFDINKRSVVQYDCSSTDNKKDVKSELTKRLENKIINMIEKYERKKSESTISVDLLFCDKNNGNEIVKNLSIKSINLISKVNLSKHPLPANMPQNIKIMDSILNKRRNEFVHQKNLCRYKKIPFYIRNSSSSSISDVHIELCIPKKNGVDVICLPIESQNSTVSDLIINDSITENNTSYLIRLSFKNMQPARCVFFDTKYFIGADESCDIEIPVTIYANELKEPQQDKIFINIEVEEKHISLNELISKSFY